MHSQGMSGVIPYSQPATYTPLKVGLCPCNGHNERRLSLQMFCTNTKSQLQLQSRNTRMHVPLS